MSLVALGHGRPGHQWSRDGPDGESESLASPVAIGGLRHGGAPVFHLLRRDLVGSGAFKRKFRRSSATSKSCSVESVSRRSRKPLAKQGETHVRPEV